MKSDDEGKRLTRLAITGLVFGILPYIVLNVLIPAFYMLQASS